jgi:hypothetical protein
MSNSLSEVASVPTLIVGGVLAVATAPVWLPVTGVVWLCHKAFPPKTPLWLLARQRKAGVALSKKDNATLDAALKAGTITADA